MDDFIGAWATDTLHIFFGCDNGKDKDSAKNQSEEIP
jgi:hypothetical protein